MIKTNSMFLLIFFILGISSTSKAGYEVGNGGIVVVCRDSDLKITTVELLDIYELRQRKRISSHEMEKKYTSSSQWIENIYKKAPKRAQSYQQYLNNFELESVYYNDRILPTTKDSGKTIKVPDNCNLEQLIVQSAKAHPFDKRIRKNRYLIAKNYWERLSPLNKEAAKLHEAVYRERINQCIELNEGDCFPMKFSLNSESVRRLVGVFITETINLLDQNQLNTILILAGFRRLELNGSVYIDKTPN